MPRLDERSHNLLRAGYYMRHPVSRVADDFTSFAHDHGLLLSDSTARRAIEGRVASEEAVTLAYRFVEHCKSNGRGIFVPPEPPITREEVVEYIKQHGTPTWFYKHVFSDLPYSTFVTF